MTAEGIFPKADGDIFYATDANTVYPKVLGFSQQNAEANASGTSIYTQVGGAANYLGSGLSKIQLYMTIIAGVYTKQGTESTNSWRARISGAGLNFATATTTFTGGLTSTVNGTTFIQLLQGTGIVASGGNLGSPYVVTMEALTNDNANSACMANMLVTGF